MVVDLSKLRKGLTSDQFKNEFQKLQEVKDNPSLMGNTKYYWDLYSADLNTSNTRTNTTSSSNILSPQQFTTGTGLVSSEAASELIGADKIASAAEQVGSALFGSKSLKSGLTNLFTEGLNQLYEGAIGIIGKEVELRNRVNGQIGLSGELSRGYRDSILDSYSAVQGMGYSFNELSETAIQATEQTGRFFSLNEKTMMNMAQTSRAFIGDIREMATIFRNFELVGVGAETALENINDAGKESLSLGLNARKTTEELTKNLGKLNEYGFQNGVQGLASMVRKATEFRMSMDEAFKVAEKVMSPEGAIDLSANLQVLGGAIGSLGDPFQMMYMATNNVEGLQDALINAAGSLATYNQEQGKFEITGVNLRRAKAMAQELGISYQELAKGAIAAAERSSVASDLISAGLTMNEKDQEFITNLAKMGPGGRMVIEVPASISEKLGIDRQTAIENLDQNTADALLKNRAEIEKMNVKDVALNQFTETQKMALNVSEIAAMLKVEFAKTYRGLGVELDKVVKRGNDMIEKYITGESSSTEISSQIDNLRSELNNKMNENTKSKTTSQPLRPTKVNNSENTTQNQQPTNKQVQTNGKMDVNVNVKTSGPVVDAVANQILKDQSLFKDILNRDPRSYFYLPESE